MPYTIFTVHTSAEKALNRFACSPSQVVVVVTGGVAVVVVTPLSAVVVVGDVSGVTVDPSGYGHMISVGGLVASGLGHQVTAVVVGETKQPGLCSPTSS